MVCIEVYLEERARIRCGGNEVRFTRKREGERPSDGKILRPSAFGPLSTLMHHVIDKYGATPPYIFRLRRCTIPSCDRYKDASLVYIDTQPRKASTVEPATGSNRPYHQESHSPSRWRDADRAVKLRGCNRGMIRAISYQGEDRYGSVVKFARSEIAFSFFSCSDRRGYHVCVERQYLPFLHRYLPAPKIDNGKNVPCYKIPFNHPRYPERQF